MKKIDDKLISLYVDSPIWQRPIIVDDFIVTVSKIKSNSVYHVAEVRSTPDVRGRRVRYNMKCYRSDLITCLKREDHQSLIIMSWYSRDKKK